MSWLVGLLILCIIAFIILYLRKYIRIEGFESRGGFSQDLPFLAKQQNKIYDEFYVDIYDEIHATEQRFKRYLSPILKQTGATQNTSFWLDVGCGTGYSVSYMTKQGFHIVGVDKSQDMCDYGESIYKIDKDVIEPKDIKDSMLFVHDTFTHITCLYYTFYELKNPTAFLQNSFAWLKLGGFLIIHLCDIEQADFMPLITFDPLLSTQPTTATKDFGDFTYTVKVARKGDEVNITEKFEDVATKNIRQNENILNILPIETIKKQAKDVGFYVDGEPIELSYKGQYIYLFEKRTDLL